MQTIPAEIIQQLLNFYKHKDMFAILVEVYILNQYDRAETETAVETEKVECIRKQCNTILSTENFCRNTEGNLSRADVIYNILIALAEYQPINKKDPFTLDEENKEDCVFVSTGHKINIYELVCYHNVRGPRGGFEKELSEKSLLNPMTNTPFSPRDVAHIQVTAAEKGIAINHLIDDETCKRLSKTHLEISFITADSNVCALLDRRYINLHDIRVWDCETLLEVARTTADPNVYYLLETGQLSVYDIRVRGCEATREAADMTVDPNIRRLLENTVITIDDLFVWDAKVITEYASYRQQTEKETSIMTFWHDSSRETVPDTANLQSSCGLM